METKVKVGLLQIWRNEAYLAYGKYKNHTHSKIKVRQVVTKTEILFLWGWITFWDGILLEMETTSQI